MKQRFGEKKFKVQLARGFKKDKSFGCRCEIEELSDKTASAEFKLSLSVCFLRASFVNLVTLPLHGGLWLP
jgi:hypothetical protein